MQLSAIVAVLRAADQDPELRQGYRCRVWCVDGSQHNGCVNLEIAPLAAGVTDNYLVVHDEGGPVYVAPEHIVAIRVTSLED